MIEARVICDSVGPHSPRLTTFLTRYPKFVHAEHCRHRTHSFCVSSSRAIPLRKTLEEVRSDELRAAPAFWGAEQKGMSPGGEHQGIVSSRDWGDQTVQDHWRKAALSAADYAEDLHEAGYHKSICNRLLDPFLHVNVLVTSCEPGLLNFFGLRLDRAADPTIRAVAEAMWVAWQESEPRKLGPGEWHLPFEPDPQEAEYLYLRQKRFDPNNKRSDDEIKKDIDEGLLHISAARCARLSYTSFETGKRSTVEEDLALYDRLLGAQPIHASPAEHQATPDYWLNTSAAAEPDGEGGIRKYNLREPPIYRWARPEKHGNLPGWVQHRKLLPGEAVAPLPEGYAP